MSFYICNQDLLVTDIRLLQGIEEYRPGTIYFNLAQNFRNTRLIVSCQIHVLLL